MKINLTTILLTFLLSSFYSAAENRNLSGSNIEKIAGITLGLHSLDYNFDYTPMLLEIKATGSPWICLNFKFYQDTIDANIIEIPDTTSAYWKQLETTTRQAKKLGFKVALLPIVLLKRYKEKEWRGKIKPINVNEWFQNYEKLLLQICQLANTQNVDMLFAGSEFSSLQNMETEWINLLANVKGNYSGYIAYSVNWDAFDEIPFINQLDLLGISGYYSLTNLNNPSEKQLTRRWQYLRKKIEQKQAEINIPIFFSEIGYASQNGINKNPWDYYISNEVDLEEQADCFAAFNKTWLNHKNLAGVFFYEWFGEGGECDTGYTPKSKPALTLIKQWFKQ